MTKRMMALFFASSLCSAVTLAAEVDAAQTQDATKESAAMGQPAATLGGQMDDCPMHKPGKSMVQGMGKDDEHCPFPSNKMHQAHMSAVQDQCDLHDKENAGEECMTRSGERCPCQHDAKHKLDHEACDPAKEAAKMSKLTK